ncbi:hypothetical protein BDQ17DRAFT_1374289, partial [Cyathus striatus]
MWICWWIGVTCGMYVLAIFLSSVRIVAVLTRSGITSMDEGKGVSVHEAQGRGGTKHLLHLHHVHNSRLQNRMHRCVHPVRSLSFCRHLTSLAVIILNVSPILHRAFHMRSGHYRIQWILL